MWLERGKWITGIRNVGIKRRSPNHGSLRPAGRRDAKRVPDRDNVDV